MRRHILTVGIRDHLRNALENTTQRDKIQIISSPSIKAAVQLLTRQRFAVILVDLELFVRVAPDFSYGFKQRSPYVIVLGNAGTKYARRVEDDAHLFLSDNACKALVTHYESVIFADWRLISQSGWTPGSKQQSSKGGAAQS